MRLFEFDNQLAAQVKSNLIFLRNLSGDASKIKVDALINILRKQHILLSYDALKGLFDQDPSLKNIIKDFNREEIKLNPEDEQEPELPDTDTAEPEEPEDEKDNIEDKVDTMAKGAKGSDRVAKMASSAAKRRS
jgi:hypothetical protein